ncbi:MAG TPA: hypothetical protein VHC20_05515 [Candidatus Paceibacterota bacterium]|nr:hypothetical protein [Candidatus Paceibacterota bacterium]
MKTIFALIATLAIATTAHAQWVVYDPAIHTQQILDQAQNVAKYIEMIENQIQQINTLTSQLRELEQYNRAFGDPSRLLNITGVTGLLRDLRHAELGQSIEQIRRIADGSYALTYDGSGIYHSVGTTFRTPSGTEIERDEEIYRDNAAIQRTTDNYTSVADDVRDRRRVLKDQIAATTEQLQSATTDAEVQKLTGVLIGLNAALAATDKEVDQAVSLTVVQQAENKNDAERQLKARNEEQKAEFSESLRNYRQTFQPMAEPPIFPENGR